MKPKIPTPEDVRATLEQLKHAQMQRLATLSGVPFTTLWKLRNGETASPRLRTVNQFMPFIDKIVRETDAA